MKKFLVWSGSNLEILLRELGNVVDNFVARVDDRGNLCIWSHGSGEIIVGLGGVILIEGRKIKNCFENNNVVKS